MISTLRKTSAIDSMPAKSKGRWPLLGAVTVLLLIEFATAIWIACDHSTPCYDTGVHRLASITMCELLQHAHCRSLAWYHNLFTVNPLYPPLFYFLSGALKVLLGKLACTDRVVILTFVAIQFLAVYQAAYYVCKTRLAAIMAGAVCFLYPMTFWAAHSVLLDCGANAMVALGLCAFLWWSREPNRMRSFLLGIVFGLAMLAKSHTVAFFVGPVLIEMIMAVKERDLSRIRALVIVAIIAGLVILPWVCLAGPTMLSFVANIQQQDFGTHDRLAEFWDNLYRYAIVDPQGIVLSPLLFYVFVAALLFSMRSMTRDKVFLIASLVVGLLVCSSFRWLHSHRYIVPGAVTAAVLTADMLSQAWSTRRMVLRGLCILVFSAAVLQFLVIGFAPYPIRLPAPLEDLSKQIVIGYGRPRFERRAMGVSFYPVPAEDWGMLWTISTIEKAYCGKQQILGAMPSSDAFGASPLTYLILTRGYHISLIPVREYAVSGDLVVFNEDYASKVADWYLLKTGDQGREFADQKSSVAYSRWCDFIRNSNRFVLIATKPIPDGSILQLYRSRKSLENEKSTSGNTKRSG